MESKFNIQIRTKNNCKLYTLDYIEHWEYVSGVIDKCRVIKSSKFYGIFLIIYKLKQ